jgi:hypothetical protein
MKPFAGNAFKGLLAGWRRRILEVGCLYFRNLRAQCLAGIWIQAEAWVALNPP